MHWPLRWLIYPLFCNSIIWLICTPSTLGPFYPPKLTATRDWEHSLKLQWCGTKISEKIRISEAVNSIFHLAVAATVKNLCPTEDRALGWRSSGLLPLLLVTVNKFLQKNLLGKPQYYLLVCCSQEVSAQWTEIRALVRNSVPSSDSRGLPAGSDMNF